MRRSGNDVLQRNARPGSPQSRVPTHELIRPTIVQLVVFFVLLFSRVHLNLSKIEWVSDVAIFYRQMRMQCLFLLDANRVRLIENTENRRGPHESESGQDTHTHKHAASESINSWNSSSDSFLRKEGETSRKMRLGYLILSREREHFSFSLSMESNENKITCPIESLHDDFTPRGFALSPPRLDRRNQNDRVGCRASERSTIALFRVAAYPSTC